MKPTIQTAWNASPHELSRREQFFGQFKECPIPDNELLGNLPLFLSRQHLSSLLFMVELYRTMMPVHGVIMEFGVRWGRNLALLANLRGALEPFNHNRKIVGFDTFAGFPSVAESDGRAAIIKQGAYNVTEGYENYLAKVLDYHESESPIAHIKKYELRKGDATVEVETYLKENPQTIVAFAYFDFDLFEPTLKCLQAIRGHLTRGSVLGFDELNAKEYPGETLALKQALGLDRYSIRHSPLSPTQSYLIVE